MKVVVTGGTHGNEYTGVWVVKRFRSCPELMQRRGLEVSTLLSNPQAIRENRRFIDTDLNRAFAGDVLDDCELPGYEHNRAKAINALLGPKGEAAKTDFIIDLHTSTANMGVTFCLQPGDPLALRCAAYVQAHMQGQPVYLLLEGATTGAANIANTTGAGAVNTVSRHGLEVEVGPTPQGVLRDHTTQLMETAVGLCLDYLASVSAGSPLPVPRELGVYLDCGKIPWEVDADGFPTACTHTALQGKDYQPLRKGDPVLRHIDGSITCYNGDPSLVPVFVNEAAYYSVQSGLGIGLARPALIDTESMQITERSKL